MQMMQPREGTPLRELGRRYVGLPSGQWTHWLVVGQCLWLLPWLWLSRAVLSRGEAERERDIVSKRNECTGQKKDSGRE